MNTLLKLARLLAILVGAFYLCATIYIVAQAPEMFGFIEYFGWYAAAFAQFAVGIVLVGVGLGFLTVMAGSN